MVDVAKDMGLTVVPQDISVSHRLPARGGQAKPIIAKFVRRDVKTQLMRNKKKLREHESRKNVYVNEDLTPFRSKLVRELRKDETIKSVWTIDGKIFCTQDERGKEYKRVITSPDDLFKVGWPEEKVYALGFFYDL